jgi:hypothetical protein
MVLIDNVIARTTVSITLVAVLLGCQDPPSSVKELSPYTLTQTDPVAIRYPQPAENVTIGYFCPERGAAVVSAEQHTRFLDSVPTGIPIEVHASLACVLAINFEEGSHSPLVISVYYGDKPEERVVGVFPDNRYYLLTDPRSFERALRNLEIETGWKE